MFQDNLNVAQNTKLLEYFSSTEKVLFSGELLKVNKKNNKQKRKIIITDEAIYNIRDDNIFTMIGFGKVVKRRIAITNIKAIIYARLGNEFVIHVPDEFDYRIIDPKKDLIINYILYALTLNGIYETKIYFNSEVELHRSTTHNSQKKKGITKAPAGEPMMMTCETFTSFIDEKQKLIREDDDNTEMLINFLNNFNKITINSFDILKVLGKGGFATVYLAQKKDTEEFYALKAVRKLAIIEKNQFGAIRREKDILSSSTSSPFLVDLKCAFQTSDKLWLVMPYIAGGDLSQHLKKRGTFWENEVKFFAAQIILGLQDLHEKGIIYQDLKPANVLLDTKGFIKLTDFGASKYAHQTKNYKTFVGTLDFIAPEIQDKKQYNKSIDWWALGILIYQLLYGYLPFQSKNPKVVVEKIKHSTVEFPEDECSVGAITDKCKDFIRSCMKKNPEERLGYNSTDEQTSHSWFEDIEFDKLKDFYVNPPLIPEMDVEEEVSDDEKDEKNSCKSIVLSVLSEGILEEVQKFDPMFKGFYLDQLTHCVQQDLDITKESLFKNNEVNRSNSNNQIEFSNNAEKNETLDESTATRHRLNSTGNQSEKLSLKDVDTWSFCVSKHISRRERLSELKLAASLSKIDFDGDGNSVSVSEVGSRLVSPPPLSPTMSAKNEGRIGYKFNFDLQSPSILLVKEKSLTQNGIESSLADDLTNTKNDSVIADKSNVQIQKKILDDVSISNSDVISKQSLNMDVDIEKHSTNNTSNMDEKDFVCSYIKLSDKVIDKPSIVIPELQNCDATGN